MLVGEVRAATVGVGISWKLSGGSQISKEDTKVSKKCQVLRAVRPRKASCSAVNSGAGASSGLLIHQAIHGAASQTQRIGEARASSAGRVQTRKPALARATAGAIHMVIRKPGKSARAMRSVSLDVCHS